MLDSALAAQMASSINASQSISASSLLRGSASAYEEKERETAIEIQRIASLFLLFIF